MFCKVWINWLSIKKHNFLLKKKVKIQTPTKMPTSNTLSEELSGKKVVSLHKIEKKIKAYQEARADL